MIPQADSAILRFLPRLALFAALCGHAHAQVPPSFAPLLQTLWPDAQARGISRKTFDLASAKANTRPARCGGDYTPTRIRHAGRHVRESHGVGRAHRGRGAE